MNCSICGRSSLAATYYMYRKDDRLLQQRK